jgi:hypothetical protein
MAPLGSLAIFIRSGKIKEKDKGHPCIRKSKFSLIFSHPLGKIKLDEMVNEFKRNTFFSGTYYF